jgi:histidine triad (HIT) family protein
MNYTGTDFYCDVAIPNTKDLQVVYEDADVLAYHHTKPNWETHIVCVPKKHIPSFTKRNDGDDSIVLKVLDTVHMLAANIEKESGGCKIITNTGTFQDSKHLHFHLCSGQRLQMTEYKNSPFAFATRGY